MNLFRLVLSILYKVYQCLDQLSVSQSFLIHVILPWLKQFGGTLSYNLLVDRRQVQKQVALELFQGTQGCRVTSIENRWCNLIPQRIISLLRYLVFHSHSHYDLRNLSWSDPLSDIFHTRLFTDKSPNFVP